MNKLNIETIRRIYFIFTGVFVIAMGITFICVAADIYYTGDGVNAAFIREVVAERLLQLAIPFIVLIGVIAVGFLFPVFDHIVKPNNTPRSLRILEKKWLALDQRKESCMPEKNYLKWTNAKRIVLVAESVVMFSSAVAVLCYLFNTAHFLGQNVTSEVLMMVKHVLPWIISSFTVIIFTSCFNAFADLKRLRELKNLVSSCGAAEHEKEQTHTVHKVNKSFENDKFVWILRVIILILAILFIVFGTLNGGARDVMIKAINICTECIGLG